MPDSKPTPLAEWMHLHSVSQIKMAKNIAVSRQTISRIVQGNFEKVDTATIRKIANHTGLTWESICSDESSQTHRRTGIPIVDAVIPNLIRDLSQEDTVTRYKKFISPHFQCTSPHYFQPAPGRLGQLWAVTEGEVINGETIDYSKGYIDWETMCRYNLPDLDQAKQHERFTTVESIDIMCRAERYKVAREMVVITKSIWHQPHQLYTMPLTFLRIRLERPVVESTEECPPRIKSWWWMELPSP